jgi:glycosyltransferase involved in cell wall biosynthesis
MTQATRAKETSHSLTVFVPALNEERHIEAAVRTILHALSASVESYEIIVVNDGSTDQTPRLIDRLARLNNRVRALHHPERRGLGAAYMTAVDEARKEYFVFIPGDDSWPHDSILELFRNLGRADVITSYATNPWARRGGLARRFLSSGYTVLLNILHGLNLQYYNGLTIYPIAFLRTKPIQTFGFGFAAEALLHAIYRGMTYIEIALPIQELEGGISKAVTLKNIVSVAATVLRSWWDLHIRRVHGGCERGRRVEATFSGSTEFK